MSTADATTLATAIARQLEIDARDVLELTIADAEDLREFLLANDVYVLDKALERHDCCCARLDGTLYVSRELHTLTLHMEDEQTANYGGDRPVTVAIDAGEAVLG